VNSLEAYDPTTDEWTRLADMSVARNAIGAVMVDGFLYAISGWDRGDSATGIVEAYDFEENVWQRRADIPSPRGWGSTLKMNGKIYCIAGANRRWRNGFCVYDPQKDEWQELNNDLVPSFTEMSVPLENKIYLFCNQPLLTAVYDIETDRWESKTPMPTPRGDFRCRVIGQRIYLIGGWVEPGVVSDAVEAYDPATDTWEQLNNLNVARWNCGDVILNHNLYVLGGLTTFRESSSHLTDTVEVLALGETPVF
jgi:N-acetylneuraminic acid mutarotase